jgi:hypothetical protein
MLKNTLSLAALLVLAATGSANAQSHWRGRLIGDFSPGPTKPPKGDIAMIGGIIPGGRSPWFTIPIAVSNGDGTFGLDNRPAGGFSPLANDPFVTPIAGFFDNDDLMDVVLVGRRDGLLTGAFGRSGGIFQVLSGPFANNARFAFLANHGAPLIQAPMAVGGDFNGDGMTDIALVGGSDGFSPWDKIVVLMSDRSGSYRTVEPRVPNFPTHATQPRAQVVAGEFSGDGCMDLALVGGFTGAPGGGLGFPWSTISTAISSCDGTDRFFDRNVWAPEFATYAAQGAMAVAGDFDGDGHGDIALAGGRTPAGDPWSSIPVAFSDGFGGFTVTNERVWDFPVYATQLGAQLIATDLDGDWRDDLALVGGVSPGFGGTRRGPAWNTIPVARSLDRWTHPRGSFAVTNSAAVAGYAALARQGADFIPATGSAGEVPGVLPPTVMSASQARRHEVELAFRAVDDLGTVALGGTSSSAFIPGCQATFGAGGAASCDLTGVMTSRALLFTSFTVRLSNTGCFDAGGIVQVFIDGQSMFRFERPSSLLGHCGVFFERTLAVDLQHGTVF